MRPTNSFIDESAMKESGEPIEYTPAFGSFCPGLVVREITQEEWDEAVQENIKLASTIDG